MSSNVKKVVDVHYHLFSPNLAREMAECVPIPSRYDPQRNVKRTTMGAEAPVVSEEEQLAEAERTGINTLWVSVRTPGFFDRGLLPSTSPHCLTLSRTIND